MARVSGNSSVSMQSNNSTMQSTILRNVDMSMECNDLVTICPVVRVSEESLGGGVVLIVMHLSDLIDDDWNGQCFHCYGPEKVSVQDSNVLIVIWSSDMFL